MRRCTLRPPRAWRSVLSGDIMHQDHRTAFGMSLEPVLNLAIPNWYFSDRFTTNQNDANFEKIDVGGGSLLVNWTLPGGLLFTSITADRINNFNLDNDDDAGPITLTHSHFIDKSAMFSQEFRLTSKQGAAYDYVAGLYYLDENVRANRHTAVVPWPAEDLGIVDAAQGWNPLICGVRQPQLSLCAGLDTGRRACATRSTAKTANFIQSVNVPLGFQSPLHGIQRCPAQRQTGFRRCHPDLEAGPGPARPTARSAKASRAAASRPTSSTSATSSPSASSPKPR